jgi:chloride channel protein, CIC family
MGLLGFTSYWFPQILGNGKDLSELLFTSQVAPLLMLTLLFLKPIATIFCVRSGAPGGMFTPSLTAGALLGGILGVMWSAVWPGTPPGLFALLGAGAMIGATTQGPISAVVLLMELTGRDRAFVLPLLLMVCGATLIARTIEPRSIYDARLTDEQIAERQRLLDLPSQ